MYKKFYYLFILTLMVTAQAEFDLKSYKFIESNIKPVRKSRNKNYNKKLLKKHTTGFSTNWCGYGALTNLVNPVVNSVSQVSGYWIVPQLSPSKGQTFSSAWVGIDGFVSPTVEQTGTEHDWINGKQFNYAWFEMYPLAEDRMGLMNFPVDIGDLISGMVSYLGNSIFMISLTNHTKKVFTIIPTKYTTSSVAKRSSAEWIIEAPCCTFSGDILPLAHFNKINFYNCTATINNVTGSIDDKSWKNEKLIMITNNNIPKALASALTCGGRNFNATWKHE
ncbi:MAG: G1 family endopeptidase [Candidatus Babeliales bacterium]|nr:G1 family endopeptidase [Candidatus Babeliales bacterium]